MTTNEENIETVRKEDFFQVKTEELTGQVKELQYECAELVKSNDELKERVKKLSSRPPKWPDGYRPRRHIKN